MPELPEVQTIVNDLNKTLTGKRVAGFKLLDKRALNTTEQKFSSNILNKKVKSVFRRAKTIVIDLGEVLILIHLKMTGQLVLKTKANFVIGGHPIVNIGLKLPNKFTRAEFLFSSSSQLFFNDVRRFGWIKLISKNDYKNYNLSLGIEPLNTKFTLDKFKEILQHKKKTTIKQALLDQKYLVGLGNIYVDESLFLAGIKPTRRVNTLTKQEINQLWRVIPKILTKAIKYRGTSFSDYVDSKGEKGNFISQLKVYGRGDQKCKKCNSIIEKIKLGGRGTHFCGKCQY